MSGQRSARTGDAYALLEVCVPTDYGPAGVDGVVGRTDGERRSHGSAHRGRTEVGRGSRTIRYPNLVVSLGSDLRRHGRDRTSQRQGGGLSSTQIGSTEAA